MKSSISRVSIQEMPDQEIILYSQSKQIIPITVQSQCTFKLWLGVIVVIIVIVFCISKLHTWKQNIKNASNQMKQTSKAMILEKKQKWTGSEVMNQPINPLLNDKMVEQQIFGKSLAKDDLKSNELVYKHWTNNNFIELNRTMINLIKIRRNTYRSKIKGLKRMINTWQTKYQKTTTTHLQFISAVNFSQYTPMIKFKNIPNDQMLKSFQIQRQYFEDKYSVSQYQQLPFCIIVPTYKNSQFQRYYFNLYSILQQQYNNYRVVIIDDFSDDKTADLIEQELSIHDFAKQKVILVRNSQHKNHNYNIYMAVHTYCQEGEILAIVDGDDQLIGRQVFKLFNAYYHRVKPLAAYSNYIQVEKNSKFIPGQSRHYPFQVKSLQTYRTSDHCYSHLRTVWVDLYLQIDIQHLQDGNGHWFDTSVDNAIFLSLFELACEQVQYVPEYTYRYNSKTGNSMLQTLNVTYRKNISELIKQKPRLLCLKNTNLSLYQKIKHYMD